MLVIPDSPLIFYREGGERFQIGTSALQRMLRYVQDQRDKKEAGGVLLGRHILTTRDVVVDSITIPMPSDRRERYHFFRARHLHQVEIDKAWASSQGTCTYLGEWHTHPQADPVPSCTDRSGWYQRLLRDRFTEPLFFVIVGTRQIRVWEGRRILNLRPLTPLEEPS